MNDKKPDLHEIRERLKGKMIQIMPYCHADIAWTHTRRWHLNRYLKVLEDVFEMMDKYPSFKWFMDSWSEFLQPCFQTKPEYIPKFQQLLKEGRVSITCGHYGNLRMTQVGNETILRNIILGKRKVRELFPDAGLSVYANLDVAIGHSQVPQIMKLAGIDSYLAWRPETMLDARGIPRSFKWEGLSGDTIFVRRHSYGSSFPKNKNGWEDIWDQIMEYLWESHLKVPARENLQVISLCLGRDDARPLRRYPDDSFEDIPALIETWNGRESSQMEFATPPDVFRELKKQEELLPTVKGVLDPAEVSYNIAFGGRKGIWWLRELADRKLVEAEILATIASLMSAKRFSYPFAKLGKSWEDLLSVCPHGVQYLFANDFDENSLRLKNCINTAEDIGNSAREALVPVCLTLHAEGMAVINSLPIERREMLEILYPNCDLRRGNIVFRDSRGAKVNSQLIEMTGYGERSEFRILLEVTVPPCGYTCLRHEWETKSVEITPKREIENMSLTVASNPLSLTFENGYLTGILDKEEGINYETVKENSFLEPVLLPYKSPTWLPTEMAAEPVPFEPESLSLTENGPLRWRVTRKGKAGVHTFKQHIDLIKGRKFIEVYTEFCALPEVTYVGISLPIDKNSVLKADIPFGLEERDIDNIPYGLPGGMECHIPGIFWARQWVSATSHNKGVVLVAGDGDRYYWRDKKGKRLVHFMARIMRKPENGWESLSKLGSEAGYHHFHHTLLLNDGILDEVDIVRQAQIYRHPLSWHPVSLPEEPQNSFLNITPPSVMLSAFYRDGRNIILRISRMGDSSVTATITLPFNPESVEPVDLEGNRLDIEVKHKGRQVAVELKKWQILTLRLQ